MRLYKKGAADDLPRNYLLIFAVLGALLIMMIIFYLILNGKIDSIKNILP
jgi:hypothetical protein